MKTLAKVYFSQMLADHYNSIKNYPALKITMLRQSRHCSVDWLQSLKQFFINVSYQILVASLTLMALFYNRAIRVRLALCFTTEPSEFGQLQVFDITH